MHANETFTRYQKKKFVVADKRWIKVKEKENVNKWKIYEAMGREKTREIEIEMRITSHHKVSCSSRTRKQQTTNDKTRKRRYLRRSTLKLSRSIGFIIGEMKEKAKVFKICSRTLISLWLWAFLSRDKQKAKVSIHVTFNQLQ